jgi:serine/threonine-protein kinase
VGSEQGSYTTDLARARIGGTVRGRWRLEALLAHDRSVATYLGRRADGLRGGVRVLALELAADAPSLDRFWREALVSTRAAHPGLPVVLDRGVAEDGAPFYVTDVALGASVERIFAGLGSATIDEALVLVGSALEALGALHAAGYVHGDLTPASLFVTAGGGVKLVELHAARALGTEGAAESGGPFGAPEQALGVWRSVDARSDLWALGACAFWLLTGRPVRDAAPQRELLLAAVSRPAPPLASVVPTMPAPVAALIDRALALDRAARWPSAAAMHDAVRGALAGRTATQLTRLSDRVRALGAAAQAPAAAPAAPAAGTETLFVPARIAPSVALPFESGAAPPAPTPKESEPGVRLGPAAEGTGTVFGVSAPVVAAVPFQAATRPPEAHAIGDALGPVLAADRFAAILDALWAADRPCWLALETFATDEVAWQLGLERQLERLAGEAGRGETRAFTAITEALRSRRRR